MKFTRILARAHRSRWRSGFPWDLRSAYQKYFGGTALATKYIEALQSGSTGSIPKGYAGFMSVWKCAAMADAANIDAGTESGIDGGLVFSTVLYFPGRQLPSWQLQYFAGQYIFTNAQGASYANAALTEVRYPANEVLMQDRCLYLSSGAIFYSNHCRGGSAGRRGTTRPTRRLRSPRPRTSSR